MTKLKIGTQLGMLNEMEYRTQRCTAGLLILPRIANRDILIITLTQGPV
jgi:hypothetical protein